MEDPGFLTNATAGRIGLIYNIDEGTLAVLCLLDITWACYQVLADLSI